MINVTFVLKEAETNHGQNVFVVGNIRELGQWDISKAIKLQTDEEFYPMWTSAEILLSLEDLSYDVEYKFVKI